MKLADLDNKNYAPDILLVQTPSSKLELFLEDKAKRMVRGRRDTIIDIETKKDISRVREVRGVSPPFSDRWFVKVDLEKHHEKELLEEIRESTTCLFFCVCSKYKTFKTFKSNKFENLVMYDYYINYLRRSDFLYLYDAFVPSTNRLTKQLFDWTIQGYSGDIEAVFELLLHLGQGEEVKNRKDIVDICGLGGLTIESFIFSFIQTELSGSAKGLETVMHNRIKAGTELMESLGSRRMYNFMNKSLTTLMELKMLLISGAVYKAVRNLPDGFDEQAIARYQKYIWKLNKIPMSKFVKLRQSLGNKVWVDEVDLLYFVYRFYSNEAQELLMRKGDE